jgi:hypothetical protein
MATVTGSITKIKGKSRVKLAVKTKKGKDGKAKKIPHAKWVEFRARLEKLAKHYGITVKLAK